MIPSIMCYVPPSVELLGPATTSFQTRIHDPQISNQIDTPDFNNDNLSQFSHTNKYTLRLHDMVVTDYYKFNRS